MSILWNEQHFRKLREHWLLHRDQDPHTLSEEELALRGRYEDILHMIESDRIWPPVTSPRKQKFESALCEVLSRLPEKDFAQIESEVGFVLEDPSIDMLAVNVPAPPGPYGAGKAGIDTIVFFRTCLRLGDDALAGLVAHELAHTFVNSRDYGEDEAAANRKALAWGFGRELDCLQREGEKLRCVQHSQSSISDRPDRGAD